MGECVSNSLVGQTLRQQEWACRIWSFGQFSGSFRNAVDKTWFLDWGPNARKLGCTIVHSFRLHRFLVRTGNRLLLQHFSDAPDACSRMAWAWAGPAQKSTSGIRGEAFTYRVFLRTVHNAGRWIRIGSYRADCIHDRRAMAGAAAAALDTVEGGESLHSPHSDEGLWQQGKPVSDGYSTPAGTDVDHRVDDRFGRCDTIARRPGNGSVSSFHGHGKRCFRSAA